MKSRDLKDLKEEVLCPEQGALGLPVFPDLFLHDQNQQQITPRWVPTTRGYKWSYNPHKWPKIDRFHMALFSPPTLWSYGPLLKQLVAGPTKSEVVIAFVTNWVSFHSNIRRCLAMALRLSTGQGEWCGCRYVNCSGIQSLYIQTPPNTS